MGSNFRYSRTRAVGRYAKQKALDKAAVIREKLSDRMHFVGALVQSPRQTGAIAPTSNDLAELMASHIDLHSDLPVLELGPGTGAITSAILKTGLAPQRLVALEFEQRFCTQLRKVFPAVNVLHGNAFDLDGTLDSFKDTTFDCVISGLPLLNFSRPMRRQLLRDALARVPHGRPLVQFSYGVRSPVELDEVADADIAVTKSTWVLKNLPPARVWTYRLKV